VGGPVSPPRPVGPPGVHAPLRGPGPLRAHPRAARERDPRLGRSRRDDARGESAGTAARLDRRALPRRSVRLLRRGLLDDDRAPPRCWARRGVLGILRGTALARRGGARLRRDRAAGGAAPRRGLRAAAPRALPATRTGAGRVRAVRRVRRARERPPPRPALVRPRQRLPEDGRLSARGESDPRELLLRGARAGAAAAAAPAGDRRRGARPARRRPARGLPPRPGRGRVAAPHVPAHRPVRLVAGDPVSRLDRPDPRAPGGAGVRRARRAPPRLAAPALLSPPPSRRGRSWRRRGGPRFRRPRPRSG
jgi:hypothetical protein